jgi:hypothetical protein
MQQHVENIRPALTFDYENSNYILEKLITSGTTQ